MESSRDIIIQTGNFAAAVQFYRDVLRFNVTYESERLVGFETGSFCLYVEPGPLEGPASEFLAPDLAAAKRELLATGCRVVAEDPGIPRCYLRDPFGLVFNLSENQPD